MTLRFFFRYRTPPSGQIGEFSAFAASLEHRSLSFQNKLALYWAQALAAQTRDKDLQARFAKISRQLGENEVPITAELIATQRKPVDMGGYYRPDKHKVAKAMRPSPALNAIVDAL